MNKKVSFATKPKTVADAEEWVSGGGTHSTSSTNTSSTNTSSTNTSSTNTSSTKNTNGQTTPTEPPKKPPEERMPTKRLTFDVSQDLHTRIKVQCALNGVKVTDALRALLEQHFPPDPVLPVRSDSRTDDGAESEPTP